MSDGYKIRHAKFEDTSEIFQLIGRNQEELLPRPTSDIIQNIDRFLVCETDGKVTGTISWAILPEIGEPGNASVEIKSLAVEEPFRGKGIGKALIDKAIEHIELLRPAQIVVLTFTPEFFSKQKFKVVEKDQLMHKLYMGCINCTKHESPFTCPETAMTRAL